MPRCLPATAVAVMTARAWRWTHASLYAAVRWRFRWGSSLYRRFRSSSRWLPSALLSPAGVGRPTPILQDLSSCADGVVGARADLSTVTAWLPRPVSVPSAAWIARRSPRAHRLPQTAEPD